MSKPAAYLLAHPKHGPGLGFGPLTTADKDAGWSETPLYAETPHPLPLSGDIGELVEEPSPNPFGELVERLQRPTRTGGTNSEDSWEAYDDLRLEAATAIETQAAEIERLKEEAETWPEWADKILKVLQSYGAAEPDEDGIDLPEALSEWMEGYEAETSAPITTLKARIAELEKERDEALRRQRELQVEHDGLRRSEREWRTKQVAAEARLKDAEKVIEAVDATAVLIQRGRTYKEYAIPGEVLGRIAAFLSTTGGDSHEAR